MHRHVSVDGVVAAGRERLPYAEGDLDLLILDLEVRVDMLGGQSQCSRYEILPTHGPSLPVPPS
jgi:hypothetical protein